MLGGGAPLLGKVPPKPALADVTGSVSDFLPATRAEALARLDAFLPDAVAYASRRNHVEPGHGNVSRLSPATRTRLLLESEIIAAARARHDTAAIEKFEQEVHWRLYWKGWLERRPGVWRRYREELARLDWSERARSVAAGESGVAIMDHFARELVETGYLHNHARMWWASFWIHVERLPWQLGADFFLRHLPDGDAASNTLSWRWVAGLHTRGKSYLVRLSNLERYVAPELLAAHRDGSEGLEDPEALAVEFEEPPPPSPIAAADESAEEFSGSRCGLWLHDEDLLVERSPLSDLRPSAALALSPASLWKKENYAAGKQRFLRTAIADGAARTSDHFGIPCPLVKGGDPGDSLAEWAKAQNLETVVALRPFVGPLADRLPEIHAKLAAGGVKLFLFRRPEDLALMDGATGGFFGYWSKLAKKRP